MDKNYFTNAMNLAKEVVIKKLSGGDKAIDATMGNGNDTVFLSKIVGDMGKIYAFDIQESALINTKEKLKDNNIGDEVRLIHDGHENMDKYINEKVKLVMFNLGYLPNAPHEITTKAETTIIALKKSLHLIEKNGVVLLVIYHGHINGKEEKVLIESFASGLNQKEYNVVKLEFMNGANNPPMLIVIEKR